MKIRRLLTAALAIAALSISLTSTSFANSADEEFVAESPKSADGQYLNGYIGVDSKPSEQLLTFTSFLLNFEGAPGSVSKVTACTSVSDSNCGSGFRFFSRSELQPCSPSNPSDCFKELIVKNSIGAPIAAKLVDQIVPNKQAFSGDSSLWLPKGGAPLLYSIPGAKHDGGELYLVKPDVVMHKETQDQHFELDKFEAAIYPVKVISLSDKKDPMPSLASTDFKDYGGQIGFAGAGGGGCDFGFTDGKNCYIPQAFPQGINFGMSLRLSHPMYGWLHGRFLNPDVQITANQANKDGVDLSITAAPLRVPVIAGFIKSEGAPEKILKYFADLPRFGTVRFSGMGPVDRSGPLSSMTIFHQHMDASEYTMTELRDWLDVLGDTSAAEPSYWLVQTVLGGKVDEVSNCTKDAKSLAGIVTTNATAYLPGPPAFDKATSSLDYKVLAPHFLKNKSVNQGTYNLVMNTDLARCIYKFNNAPIGATVSVLASDGTNNVATTLVTQDKNFIKMSASGFTYSDPTVRVKITQDAESVAPAPQASSEPGPAKPGVTNQSVIKQSKITITCIKGKTVKKVSAISPKCPAGFKKK